MWLVTNETPFEADRSAVIDKHGNRDWVVVVKATFTLHPDGTTERALGQTKPLLLPEFRGDPATSSLLYEADLVGPKLGTDFLINGTAHAPEGRPVTELPVSVSVERLRKILRVVGDRVHERRISGAIEPSPASPFLTLPIVYERAFGGHDQSPIDPTQHRLFQPNPVGVGVALRRSDLLGKPVANVEFHDAPSRPGAAAGFGPICSHWLPRRTFAGTYDEVWARTQRPLLPLDFDDRFHQCAPLDQRLDPPARGNELVELRNLTPRGTLSFRLPRHYFTFRTLFARAAKRPPAEHRARLHTVIVEPDAARLIMVWQTQPSCGRAIDEIDQTIVSEKRYVD